MAWHSDQCWGLIIICCTLDQHGIISQLYYFRLVWIWCKKFTYPWKINTLKNPKLSRAEVWTFFFFFEKTEVWTLTQSNKILSHTSCSLLFIKRLIVLFRYLFLWHDHWAFLIYCIIITCQVVSAWEFQCILGSKFENALGKP